VTPAEAIRQANEAVKLVAPNFTLYELCHTNHRAYLDENLEHGVEKLPAVLALAEMAQAVRSHYGRPLIVHSGVRCPGLNANIGGSRTSQHMKGEAVDFHVSGVPLVDVFNWIRLRSGLEYGQLILEGIQAGKPTWIHLSLGEPWRAAAKSRQAMTWSKADGYTRVTE